MRTGVFKTKDSFNRAFKKRMKATYLKDIETSNIRERYNILGTLLREEIAKDWIKTNKQLEKKKKKRGKQQTLDCI